MTAPDFEATCWPGEAVACTLFTADELRQKPQRGTRISGTWPWLVHWTSCPSIVADKSIAGGFTLASLRDGIRRNDACETVSAIAYDHDAGTVTVERAETVFRRVRHLVYTTASHTPEAPHWRAIVAVSRPMLPDEYKRLWRHGVVRLKSAGIDIDGGCSDVVRLWYSPTVRPGFEATFVHRATDGPVLDVDQALGAEARWAAEQKTEPVQARPDTSKVVSYAMGALARAADAMSATGEGDRHALLNREAYSLARLGLSAPQIEGALLRPFVAVAGIAREAEAKRTIRDAVAARGRR